MRELMAEAKMNTRTKGDVPVRCSLQIELVRIASFARGSKFAATSMGMILLPFFNRPPLEFHVLTYEARLGELYRANKP